MRITEIRRVYVFIAILFVILLLLPYGRLYKFEPTMQEPYDEAKTLTLIPFNDDDGDLLNKTVEMGLTFTDPNYPDTDRDGLCDGYEFKYWNERIENGQNVVDQRLRAIYPQYNDTQLAKQYGPTGDLDGDRLTNILDPDSDDDRIPDGWEVPNSYDPAIPADITTPEGLAERIAFLGLDYTEVIDSDNDLLPDTWEYTFDCRVPYGDDDLDGVSNLEEYFRGTHPNSVADQVIMLDPFNSTVAPLGKYKDFYQEDYIYDYYYNYGPDLYGDNYHYLIYDYFNPDAYENPVRLDQGREDDYYDSHPKVSDYNEYTSGVAEIPLIGVTVPRDSESDGTITYKQVSIDIDQTTTNSSSLRYLNSMDELGQNYYNGLMLAQDNQPSRSLMQVYPASFQRYWAQEVYTDYYYYDSYNSLSAGWGENPLVYYADGKSLPGATESRTVEVVLEGCTNGDVPMPYDTVGVSLPGLPGDSISLDLTSYDVFPTYYMGIFIWNYTITVSQPKYTMSQLESDNMAKDPDSTDFRPGFVPYELRSAIRDKAVELTKAETNDMGKLARLQEYVLGGPDGTFGNVGANWTSLDYATAFVMLAKQLGAECRMVTGYGPGAMDNGRRVIRASDEHAWAQVRFEDLGWVSFEVTSLASLELGALSSGADPTVVSFDWATRQPVMGGCGYVITNGTAPNASVMASYLLDTDLDGTPNDRDTDIDGDGLSNEEERTIPSNPLSYDTDNDGLSDREEVQIYSTSPTDADTDRDGVTDDYDTKGLPQPTVPVPKPKASKYEDAKGNGFFDLQDPDRDRDWMLDDMEHALGLDNAKADSDGDYVPDGLEVYYFLSNPRSADSDKDNALDYFEALFNGCMFSNDTDNDGLEDKQEINAPIFRLPKTSCAEMDTDRDLVKDSREKFIMLKGKDPDPPKPPIDDDDDIDLPDIPKPGWGGLKDINLPLILTALAIIVLAIVIAIILLRRKPAEDEILDIIDKARSKLQKATTSDQIKNIIIEAYKAMCKVFEGHGMPRSASETPQEFRMSMEALLPMRKEPMDELTALFELARYSNHKLKPNTRDQAISALDHVRTEILRLRSERGFKDRITKRKQEVSQRGSLSETELTKRRSGLVGMVVFHQDMGHDANQAYFLKELQRQNEKYYDHMSAQAKEQLGMENAMRESLYGGQGASEGPSRKQQNAPEVVWHQGEEVLEPGEGHNAGKDEDNGGGGKG